VLDLLKQVHFLEHLSLAEVVLHVRFLYGLNRNLLASQLVNAESYLSERSFPDQSNELVEVEGGRRQFIVLLNVLLDMLYQKISFL